MRKIKAILLSGFLLAALISLPEFCVAQMPIQLSDTISFNSSEVGQTSNRFGVGNSLLATIAHTEGLSLVYVPVGMFREQSLQLVVNEKSVRHIGLDGSVTQGPRLKRLFLDSYSHFDGSRDWTAWTAKEAPLGSEAFPAIVTEVYNNEGNSVARQEIVSYQEELVDLLDIKTATSRYGNYVVVAVLTTRRKDRLSPREEAGANLTVACISASGELLFRHQHDLPDLRARYTLKDVRLDETLEAIVLLARTPWRALIPTFEDPLIDIYEFQLVNADTDRFEPIEVLTKGFQPRGVFVVDQEPYAAGYVIPFASDLVEPVLGYKLLHAGKSAPIQVLLTPDLVENLPEFAVEASKSKPKFISGQYAPIEARYSLDGRLFVLYSDIYKPLPIQDLEILQWRRTPDGLTDGSVLAEIDFSGLSSKQTAYFLTLRQTERAGFGPFLGSTLVPVNGGYGILFNEDPDNLGPGTRRRRPVTQLSFATPFLAYVKDGQLARTAVTYESPYRFGVLASTQKRTLPNGKFVSFSALEDGFRYSTQYYFWPNEFQYSSD